jgi:hypothetical protein
MSRFQENVSEIHNPNVRFTVDYGEHAEPNLIQLS